MQVIRWNEGVIPQEDKLLNLMQQQGLSPYSWSNGPNEQYAVHSHNYEKVLYCVRGSIRFILPDYIDYIENKGIIELEPGDCLILPASTRHSAQVGIQGVTCLEAVRRFQTA